MTRERRDLVIALLLVALVLMVWGVMVAGHILSYGTEDVLVESSWACVIAALLLQVWPR